MTKYLKHLGARLSDIRKIIGMTSEELSSSLGISNMQLKQLEHNPELLTREIATRIFVIANARAKFEKDESTVALLAISFDVDELNTERFIHQLNTPQYN